MPGGDSISRPEGGESRQGGQRQAPLLKERSTNDRLNNPEFEPPAARHVTSSTLALTRESFAGAATADRHQESSTIAIYLCESVSQNISEAGPAVQKSMATFALEHSDLDREMIDWAVTEAAEAGGGSWRYVKRILERMLYGDTRGGFDEMDERAVAAYVEETKLRDCLVGRHVGAADCLTCDPGHTRDDNGGNLDRPGFHGDSFS